MGPPYKTRSDSLDTRRAGQIDNSAQRQNFLSRLLTNGQQQGVPLMRSSLRRWFRPIAVAVAILGLTAAVWGQADAIAGFDWHADPGAILAAVGLFAVAESRARAWKR